VQVSNAHPVPREVAVVVPLSNRPDLTPDEKISLRHLTHFLGSYDKYMVIPKALKVDYPGFENKRFNNRFFGSAEAHKRLLFSPGFYDAFSNYKYILMYHLDALVFSDQLMEWCDTDLDYIGAPFIKCDDSPWVKVPRVGNGGFSLRKIDSFLNVLNSSKYTIDPNEYWEKFCASKPAYSQYLNFPRKYLKRLTSFNGVRWHLWRQWKSNDDYFWADHAKHYYGGFTVAPFDVGVRFAFEVAPRHCFELNGGKLPFGCHAWARYDRNFWEPYLLK